jgi:hypothetical protein
MMESDLASHAGRDLMACTLCETCSEKKSLHPPLASIRSQSRAKTLRALPKLSDCAIYARRAKNDAGPAQPPAPVKSKDSCGVEA